MLSDRFIIELRTDDDVSCGVRKSVKEAYLLLQECKRLDRKEKIKYVKYCFVLHTFIDNVDYEQDVTITKYRNRYIMKPKVE